MVSFSEETRQRPWMEIQGRFYIYVSINVCEYLIKSTYYDKIENVLHKWLRSI